MKNPIAKTFTFLTAALLFCTGLAFGTEQPSQQVIRVASVGASAKFMDIYSKSFMNDNSGINVVITGGSTKAGIQALLEGNSEIAVTNRLLTKEELEKAAKAGKQLVSKVLGVTDVPVVTHPSNPVRTLDMDQLRGILEGKITNWIQVGGPDQPILFVALDPTSPDSTDFYKSIFIKRNHLQNLSVPSNALLAPRFSTMISKIAQTKGSIGFCRLACLDYLERHGRIDSVSILAIKPSLDDNRAYNPDLVAHKANTDKIHAGDRYKEPYEIDRAFYLYFDKSEKNPRAASCNKFVDYCVNHLHTELSLKDFE